MKILDRYILRKYLLTLITMIVVFIPIGIIVDVSEKVGKMAVSKPPAYEVLMYYLSFIAYFANILFPILIFLSVIWFTSKLANNTEVIAILSSGISFRRFLRPYFIGASIVSFVVFVMGMFIVPKASQIYNQFYDEYLVTTSKNKTVKDLYNQFSDDDYLYVSSFNMESKTGDDFSIEHFEGTELKEKITASSIRWIENDSVKTYRLSDYVKRKIGKNDDILEVKEQLDTLFPFKVTDLMPVDYAAETKNLFELNTFIERERQKGSPNLDRYLLVKYRRWATVVTAFILTIIGVAVSSVKRRGGMGVNLAFGILIGFSYVFFERIFGIFTQKSGLSPLMAVVIPNLIFLLLAVYLVKIAKK